MAQTATTTLTRRRVTLDDIDAVAALLEANDLAVVGFVDFTRDDITADLGRDDLEAYGWYDGSGALSAYAWVTRSENSHQVELDLYVHPDHDDALGDEVIAFLEDRARSLVSEAGYDEPWMGTGAYRQDSRTRAWLERAGFDGRTTFTRMRIDLDTPVPEPAPEVVIRRVTDEPDLRTAHRIDEESFVAHYGHVPTSFERWRAKLTTQGPDFAQVYLAELDGEPVGVLVGTRQFEAEGDNAGYVRTLGVLPGARGAGVATALLRDYFARCQRDGRSGVLLHVDVANVTGALRLYESVGMRPILEIDAWAKGTLAR
jgi:mycothiol synthase